MKIQRLTISNFRGITVQEIVPKGRHVLLHGPNGSGKSSTTLSLLYALAGRGTSQPVRDGADRAEVEIEVGDWIFKRTSRTDGKPSTFTGRGRDGAKLPNTPAKFVESLVGTGLALDPLALYRMSDGDQQRVILEALGVDVAEEERESATIFERRTGINARCRAADAKVTEMRDAGVSTDAAPEVSAKELHDRVVVVRKRCAAEEARAARVAMSVERKAAAEAALKAALAECEEAQAEVDAAAAITVDETCVADHAAAVRELEQVDQRNRDALRSGQLKLAIQEAETLRAESVKITARLEELAKARADKIAEAAAKLGITGIDFPGDKRGVTLGGVRLAELNGQRRLFLALQIAFAREQEMRVAVVDDASQFDNQHLRELFAWGTERDIQLVIATVDPDGDRLVVELIDGADEVID